MPDTGNSQTLRLRLAELMAGLDGAVREKIRLSPDRSVLDYSREIAGNLPFMALAAFLQENCGTRAVPHPAAEFALRFAGRGGETETGRTEVQRRLVSLLAEAGESGASDVHIADMGAYGLVRFRVRGEMRPAAEISGTLARRLIAVAFNGLGQQNGTPGFSQASRQDARIVSRSVLPPGVHSVRLHAEPIQSDTASRGTFLAMRLLTGADGVKGSLGERLAALGYSEDQCRLMASLAGSRGLTLLAGPTGHGKSTTLRHVMESMVISRPDQSYLSVEDPPEYPMAGVRQIQVPTSGGRQGISLHRRHSRRHALRPRCHHDWRDPLARGRSRCARRRADRPRRVDHSARGRRLRHSPPPHGHAHVSRRSRSQGNPLRAGRLRGTHLPAPHVPELPPLQPAALLPYRGSTAQPPSRRT